MADHILFKDIDEPGLNTIEVYRRRGGYEMLGVALATLFAIGAVPHVAAMR